MKPTSESSILTIHTAEAAELLHTPRYERFLAPFLGRERSLGSVAEELNLPISTLYRHVRRFCQTGIVKVTREQRRKGRSIKFYRTVADAFFIPNRLRAYPSKAQLESFDHAFERGIEHVYGEHLSAWGTMIYRNEDGIFSTSLATSSGQPVTLLQPSDPAVLLTTHDAVFLDFEDAKALQQTLRHLLDTYAKKGGAQRYLVRLNLLPLPEDVELVL